MSIQACLCCIVTQLNNKKQNRLTMNRSCIQKTAIEKGETYCQSLAKENIENLYHILLWNEYHGIYNFRVSSDIFPHRTNPNVSYYSIDDIEPEFEKCRKLNQKLNHRLTMHPDQFVQIGAENRAVYEKSIVELRNHNDFLEKMECDKNSVLIIHGGGIYENKSIGRAKSKEITIERWIKQFRELPQNIQERVVLENCEKCYSVEDCLKISKLTGVPVVYDSHHYRCFSVLHTDIEQLAPSQLMPQVLKTWEDRGIEPLFHISNQGEDKRIGAHSDYIYNFNFEFEKLAKQGISFQLDIEAKAKEQAIFDLYKRYDYFYQRKSKFSKEEILKLSDKLESSDFLF